MRQAISLIWKEYREQRWFLIAALVIFCGFPLIEASGRYYRPPKTLDGATMKPEFYSDAAAGLVLGLGGLLAILVAVGATTRDLRDELHVFWRSRPVSVGRWMGVKYAVGLLNVLAACTIPMLMQFWMTARGGGWRATTADEVAGTIRVHSFTVILLFTIAFLLGCLVRNATQAALLSLAAAIVVYFLPVIVAPLAPLSVFNVINEEAVRLTQATVRRSSPADWKFDLPSVAALGGAWRVHLTPQWATFSAAMLGGSIAAAALASYAVRRDWRIEADRQAMHWSLGGVALLLFGATAFQVGSNLKVARQFDLPVAKHSVVNCAFDGSRGVAFLRKDLRTWLEPVSVKVCSVEMTPDGLRCGPHLESAEMMDPPDAVNPDVLLWRRERPDRAYVYAQRSAHETQNGITVINVKSLQLLTLDLTRTSGDPVVNRLDLMQDLSAYYGARAVLHGESIFVIGGNRTLVISLANPDAPALASTLGDAASGSTRTNPARFLSFAPRTDATGRVTMDIELPTLPNTTPRERLAASVAAASQSNERATFNGDMLAVINTEGVWIYRLTTIDEKSAHFELLGRREYTPLERLMGPYATSPTIIDGRLYTSEGRGGSGMAAYDLTDPARPRSAGHFATANAHAVRVNRLLNGQLLVAADRFYVLDPPGALE